MTDSPDGHVVLIGDDGLGVRVLEELRGLEITLTAVCAREDTLFAEAARKAQVRLIVDDLENEATLRAADVENARACALLANGDLGNLHVALELVEMAPEAHLILRLFNTSLAGPVRELVGNVTVLSATELAAPAFVEAALRGSADLTLRVGDRRATVQEVDLIDPRLRLTLADAERRGQETELFPERAARVVGIVDQGPVEEERVFAAGGALDLRIASRQAGMVATLAGLYRASWLVARGLVGLIDRRLAVVAVLFALLLVSSSLVFDEELGISLLNSFYFTVTTVMGVGYGDITLLDAEPGVKLFGTAIMVLGGVALALVFALLTDAIVGARLAQALGQGPLPRRGHVVVCGAGKTGGRVIEAIAEADVPCIAIDRDAEIDNAALLKRLSVPLVVGDAASGKTLDGVRLSSARALVAVTDDDLANLQCALLAHARAPDLRVILRLFNHDLAMRVQRASGIELSHSVASLAAPAFVAAILGRPATAVVPVGSEVLLVVELTAERFSDVHTLEQDCQARVLAIDGAAFPTADAHVTSGAGVLVIGTGAALVELERRLVSSAAPA